MKQDHDCSSKFISIATKHRRKVKKTRFLMLVALFPVWLWVGLLGCTSVSQPDINSPILYSAVATPTSTLMLVSPTETPPPLSPTPQPLTATATSTLPTTTPTLTPIPPLLQ